MNSKPSIPELGKLLQEWYQQNHRPLPWRANNEAYRIWISEVMLQQTTVTAVIPYFERFIKHFPTIKDLAAAKIESVYELWAGLGYYSRAKNIHLSAQILAEKKFPKKAEELILLPGFGPYTSRAVSSIAFDEKVGVLDGNVIRVLCRLFSIQCHWWKSKNKQDLQNLSDQLAKTGKPSIMNQSLMELGATICTPQSPACLICPVSNMCLAFKQQKTQTLPLKKPRKKTEIWIWHPILIRKKNKIALSKNNYAPFLKGQLIFPGSIQLSNTKPKKYDLRHAITHHDIYIQIRKSVKSRISEKSIKELRWIPIANISKHTPSSLIKKVAQLGLDT